MTCRICGYGGHNAQLDICTELIWKKVENKRKLANDALKCLNDIRAKRIHAEDFNAIAQKLKKICTENDHITQIVEPKE